LLGKWRDLFGPTPRGIAHTSRVTATGINVWVRVRLLCFFFYHQMGKLCWYISYHLKRISGWKV